MSDGVMERWRGWRDKSLQGWRDKRVALCWVKGRKDGEIKEWRGGRGGEIQRGVEGTDMRLRDGEMEEWSDEHIQK